MKRLLGFLIVAALAACTCLSQIPDQLVYVDQNCEAILPDYTPEVVVYDNCGTEAPAQDPAPGTVLTSATSTTLVTITATDISGNTSSIEFNVVLLDTIPPTIEAGPGLLSANFHTIGKAVRVFNEGLVLRMDSARAEDPTNPLVADTSYRKDNLVMVTNRNSNIIAAAFTDPEFITFSADSTALAERCDMNIYRLRFQFVEP